LDKFKDVNIANEIKKSIWLKKSTTECKMNYEIVKLFADNLGYKIVTTQQEFNNLKEIPSMRIINIKCNEGHIWSIRTSVLLYLGTECPTCSERYKCQTIMRLFIEKIFGVPFPMTSLSRVYGVSGEKIVRIKENSYKIQIGMLSFDGYNPRVLVNGKHFKIAFEYDGRHHDDKNHYYYTRYGRDFYFVKASDTIKFNLAKIEKTIVIRLKEIDGFKLSTIDTFQNEIIRQFQELTGEVMINIPKYRYDVKSKNVIPNSNFLNNY